MTTLTPQEIEKAAGMMRSWRTRKESPAECLAAALAAERSRWQAERERLRAIETVARALKFAPYPAHGLGFVISVTGGNVNDLEAALAQPATAEREVMPNRSAQESCRRDNAPPQPAPSPAGAMRKALEGMVDHYVDMVNSGDCGYWNPENEDVVIAARRALAAD